jgi:hypothetical protein
MAGSGYSQKRVNVRIDVTLRRVRVSIVAGEKQYLLRILLLVYSLIRS